MASASVTTMRFHEWLEGQKAAARSRGGRPLRHIPRGRGDAHEPLLPLTASARTKGEVFNPHTGEFISGCLTVGRLANELGLSSRELSARMGSLGLLWRCLDWKEVPMLVQPGNTRPEYFHRYRLTPWALKESYGITITAPDGNPLDLITPDGQGFVRSNLERASGETIGGQVARILDTTPGLSHHSIARMLGCDHKTVSYHVKRLAVTRLPEKVA